MNQFKMIIYKKLKKIIIIILTVLLYKLFSLIDKCKKKKNITNRN